MNMNDDDEKAFEQFKKQSMTKIGKFFWKLGAIKWYRNGTFFSPSFRWWHPATWIHVIIFLIILIPTCMFSNISIKEGLNQLWEDLTVNKFFKENPNELRWYEGD